MVLIKSVINVFFVRFIPNDAKEVVFEKYTSLLGSFWVNLEAYWYLLASLICNRVLLTKTWHWGLPCSPTCHQIDYNYNFHHSFHHHNSIIVNCVNKHPFYGWMLFLARLLTRYYFFTPTGIYQWFVCMENLSNVISGVTQLQLRIWKGGIMKRRREDK